MSKQKNKKNKTATPKEPITRRDLCVKIHALEKENTELRSDNQMLALANAALKDIGKNGVKLANEAAQKLADSIGVQKEYRKMNRLLIAALIISCILHLVNFFF